MQPCNRDVPRNESDRLPLKGILKKDGNSRQSCKRVQFIVPTSPCAGNKIYKNCEFKATPVRTSHTVRLLHDSGDGPLICKRSPRSPGTGDVYFNQNGPSRIYKPRFLRQFRRRKKTDMEWLRQWNASPSSQTKIHTTTCSEPPKPAVAVSPKPSRGRRMFQFAFNEQDEQSMEEKEKENIPPQESEESHELEEAKLTSENKAVALISDENVPVKSEEGIQSDKEEKENNAGGDVAVCSIDENSRSSPSKDEEDDDGDVVMENAAEDQPLPKEAQFQTQFAAPFPETFSSSGIRSNLRSAFDHCGLQSTSGLCADTMSLSLTSSPPNLEASSNSPSTDVVEDLSKPQEHDENTEPAEVVQPASTQARSNSTSTSPPPTETENPPGMPSDLDIELNFPEVSNADSDVKIDERAGETSTINELCDMLSRFFCVPVEAKDLSTAVQDLIDRQSTPVKRSISVQTESTTCEIGVQSHNNSVVISQGRKHERVPLTSLLNSNLSNSSTQVTGNQSSVNSQHPFNFGAHTHHSFTSASPHFAPKSPAVCRNGPVPRFSTPSTKDITSFRICASNSGPHRVRRKRRLEDVSTPQARRRNASACLDPVLSPPLPTLTLSPEPARPTPTKQKSKFKRGDVVFARCQRQLHPALVVEVISTESNGFEFFNDAGESYKLIWLTFEEFETDDPSKKLHSVSIEKADCLKSLVSEEQMERICQELLEIGWDVLRKHRPDIFEKYSSRHYHAMHVD